MTYTFRPAVREDCFIKLGIAGPSRSGKTYSALRVAMGLTGGDPSKIFVIDTERGRSKINVEKFGAFMHADLDPPFSPERYSEAIAAADEAGAQVIIVDSASHLHEGPGGILSAHEAELEKMAGNDWAKRERVKFTAWIKPKARHNTFVQALLRVNCHLILCFRAKEKLQMVKNAKGKNEPVPIGLQPICSDGLEYEVDSLLVLPAGSKGVPDLGARASEMREPFDQMVRPNIKLDEEFGKRLAAWASGGSKAPVAEATAEKVDSLPPAHEPSAFDQVPVDTTGHEVSDDDGPSPAERFAQECRDRIRNAPLDTLPTVWREMQSDPNWRGLPDHLIADLTAFKDARKSEQQAA